METKLTIREVIEKAGGVLPVAKKLNFSFNSVQSWFYGSRRPGRQGRTRADLCRLAGVSMDDVAWERAAVRAALERKAVER